MSKNRSILIVGNPTSGRGRGGRTAESLLRFLRAADVEATFRQTQGPGDAETITQAALASDKARPDVVVACGGDGTIQQVVNAMMSARDTLGHECPALGIAPAGRCNDFARALGLSKDAQKLAHTLIHGVTQPIDLGRVNGRYFCTVATIGVDAEISRFVDGMKMPLRGVLAYLYGAMRVIPRCRRRVLKISGDFGQIEQPTLLALAANTSSYGGAIPIAPEASPIDGQFDVCIIDEVSWFRLATLVPAILRGRHPSRSEVRFLRTKSLAIDAPESLELWADGERVGHTPATIDMVPKAIDIVLPTILESATSHVSTTEIAG